MVIQITSEQLKKLDPYAFESYIDELIEHCKKCHSRLVQRMPMDVLRSVLSSTVTEAKKNGITQRASVRFYVDLKIIFGSGFKSDPQYYWINDWLEHNSHYSQLEQADFLYFKCVDYLQAIYGENDINKHEVSDKLATFNLMDYKLNKETFNADVLAIFKLVHPKKTELLTDEALQNFIAKTKKIALDDFDYKYMDQNVYFILVSYLYGHQFYSDPFLSTITAIDDINQIDLSSRNNREQTNGVFIQLIQNWNALKSI